VKCTEDGSVEPRNNVDATYFSLTLNEHHGRDII